MFCFVCLFVLFNVAWKRSLLWDTHIYNIVVMNFLWRARRREGVEWMWERSLVRMWKVGRWEDEMDGEDR